MSATWHWVIFHLFLATALWIDLGGVHQRAEAGAARPALSWGGVGAVGAADMRPWILLLATLCVLAPGARADDPPGGPPVGDDRVAVSDSGPI